MFKSTPVRINSMKQIAVLFLFIVALSPFGTVRGDSLDPHLLQSLGEVKYHELKSTKLGRSFHIFVDLPEGYDESGQNYPTIYLLDGGDTFPLMAAQHHYLRFGNETPAAILVGISYGSDTFKGGNWRQTDYTAPSEDVKFWGGAAVFQSVLQEELLPLIEGAYRSDPSHRVLFGHSIGGQFVLFNALTEPGLFFGHIASNPALHRNLPFFLEWHGGAEITAPVSRVFVASSEFDDTHIRKATLEWFDHWRSLKPGPWVLEMRTLPGQTHLSSTPEAFRLGLAWLFAEKGD
jgi:predicted alpha/beta superfamily hydrolase